MVFADADDDACAIRRDAHAVRPVQLGGRGRSFVAAVAAHIRTAARQGANESRVRVDLPNDQILRIDDLEVSGGIHGDPFGAAECGRGRRAAVAGIALTAGAGHVNPAPFV